MGILKLTRNLHGLYHTRTGKCNWFRSLSSYSNHEDSTLAVLIVSGGPVGLVLSLLLTKLGVECVVSEKSRAFSTHPQAHFINNRSMEIFRKLDGLADEILRHQSPVDLWRKFIYCNRSLVKFLVRLIICHVKDAHNLSWKLASVIRGITSPSIISTYEMERRQIATFNTALSVQNIRAAMAVPAALGLDPTIANSVHRAIDSFGSFLPSQLQSSILHGIFSISHMQLSDSLLNENNPFGSSQLSKLRKIFEEGKILQLQFPAEDLGFLILFMPNFGFEFKSCVI